MKNLLIILSILLSVITCSAQSVENLDSIIDVHYDNARRADALGDTAKAIQECKEAFDLIKQTANPQRDNRYRIIKNIIAKYFRAFYTKGKSAYRSNSLDKALTNFEKAERIYRTNFNVEKDTVFVYYVLYPLEDIHLQNKNFQKAIEYRQEITNIYEKVYGSNSKEFIDFKLDLYLMKGIYAANLDSTLFYYEQCENLWRTKHEVYKDTVFAKFILSPLEKIHLQNENYQKAIEYRQEITNIFENVYGNKDARYATSLHELAYFYAQLNKFDKAVEYDTLALNITKETMTTGNDSVGYATSLINLASYYQKLCKYNDVIELGTQALEIIKKNLRETDPVYLGSLSQLAGIYGDLGDYNKAIELEMHVLNFSDKNSSRYALSLNELSTYYAELGNFNQAIDYETQALNIYKKDLKENAKEYARSLTNLAGYYVQLGNYQKAFELVKQVLNFSDKNNIAYKNALSYLAEIYRNHGDFTKAVELETQAFDIQEKLFKEGKTDIKTYATSLSRLANDYDVLGDYDKAISYGMRALEIREEIFRKPHPDNASSLSTLASCYGHLGNYDKAIELETKSLNIRKEVYGDKHHEYASSLRYLGYFYLNQGNFNEAINLEIQNLNIVQDIVLNTFGDLSSNERQMFWNKYNYSFNNYFPKIVYKTNAWDVSSELYDKSALFAKGLLLGAETEMTKLIQENGDAEALKKYEELRMNRMALNKLYEQPVESRKISADSLENLVNAQEKELVEKCKVYGDYTKNLRLTWKDVQSHLGSQDLAVEFLAFPASKDSLMYIALTLCKNDTAPQMVTLFEQKQIITLCDTLDADRPQLKEIIWGPMQEQLKGIKNIYFAAAGLLHDIGIEYLPGMEDYNLYRLSSTRELVNQNSVIGTDSAVVYGNINYNYDLALSKPIVQLSGDYAQVTTKSVPDFGKGKTKQTVGPLGDAELKCVSAALKAAKVPFKAYSLDNATEESFKALSGKKIKLIHIDTHGFYDSEKYENIDIIKRFGMEKVSAEDISLRRCGLYFTGGNYSDGDSIPEGVDDGILTGQDVAQMDLRGLDLVVLSACKTGLGDIRQGEGVFGLQRAFKKAGAQSMIMSLWNVDANATQILMSEFYKQYTAGKTKRAAFQAAQQRLRTVNNGMYDHPKYWAAFILLDAID